MKTTLMISLLLTCLLSIGASGQNTMKLFDATAITPSDTSGAWNPRNPMVFASKDVYLSCPIGGSPYAWVTGPNNGSLITDNFFTLNGNDICPDDWNCFAGTFASPGSAMGLPVESAYIGTPPIDVSSYITGSGVYTFQLSDYSYVYGNSEIYLHTSCSFGSVVCHRNNGKAAPKTLAVSQSAVAAHLAHGDKEGPCEN
jgi:hypothetical protein